MIKEFVPQSQDVSEPADISNEFATMSPVDFSEFLRGKRRESALQIAIDLSGTTDQEVFKLKTRFLKAFLQNAPLGQQRSATIIGRKEQRKWAANELGSGVEFNLKHTFEIDGTFTNDNGERFGSFKEE